MNKKPTDYPKVSFFNALQAFELDILSLSDLKQRAANLSPPPNTPHAINFNLLIIIEQGSGEHLIDFEKITFEPNTVLFINRRQIHAFDFSSDIKGKAIPYTESFIETLHSHMCLPITSSLFESGPYSPKVHLDDSLKERTSHLLTEITSEFQQSSPMLEIIHSLFGALLLLLDRARGYTANPAPSLAVKKFIAFQKLLEHHYSTKHEAAFYADQLNISYKTLNQTCKSITGETAKATINQRIITEAKRKLLINQYDISTLSEKLGFKETSNFIKFFKRYTHKTPHQFKQEVLN